MNSLCPRSLTRRHIVIPRVSCQLWGGGIRGGEEDRGRRMGGRSRRRHLGRAKRIVHSWSLTHPQARAITIARARVITIVTARARRTRRRRRGGVSPPPSVSPTNLSLTISSRRGRRTLPLSADGRGTCTRCWRRSSQSSSSSMGILELIFQREKNLSSF